MHVKHYLARDLPVRLARLSELALDLRWSWCHVSDALWRSIDADLWNATANPWLIVESLSPERLEELARNTTFCAEFERQIEEHEKYLNGPSWFDGFENKKELGSIAYFSMEYGLGEALPIYSGGLGILAGDMLKTASDLGVPLIGIGILYYQGYFRQAIDTEGRQLAYYPFNDPAMLPVTPLRDSHGGWMGVKVELPGRQVHLRCWQVVVGRTRLFLLDSNDMRNSARDRGLTAELYGGDDETRLQQEIILGIGGWRLIEALQVHPRVCHLNEGHAALASLERASHLMRTTGMSFSEACRATRAGTIFTSHTPVPAAFDRFSPDLARQYLREYALQWGISLDALIDLGRARPNDSHEAFNLAYLALRASGAVNAVSQLHGAVSRRLFAPLFPRWPLAEVPIGHVTNGVHTPSWDSAEADRLWTKACNKGRWRGELHEVEKCISAVDDATIWNFRARQRKNLVEALRIRLAQQHANRGDMGIRLHETAYQLDPNALTLAFARRFTGYKRPNLLLRHPERLARLLGDAQRPIQLIIAGKAHPRDTEGCQMIQEWIRFIEHSSLSARRVVFIEDYDLSVAAELVQGADVWINTPRRPWEASGTSGMKILVNGGLNLSELDGWWAEAYSADAGWALGDSAEHGDTTEQDAADAEMLYRLIENSVVPMFYERDREGVPRAWIARIRASMAHLTARYSTNRVLREYLHDYYVPGAQAYAARLAQGGQLAREIEDWSRRISENWQGIRIGRVSMSPSRDGLVIDAQVFLGELPPDDVVVEIYADPRTPSGLPERHPLVRKEPLPGSVNGFHYCADIPTTRAQLDYTVRVRPFHSHAITPLEETNMLWAR